MGVRAVAWVPHRLAGGRNGGSTEAPGQKHEFRANGLGRVGGEGGTAACSVLSPLSSPLPRRSRVSGLNYLLQDTR